MQFTMQFTFIPAYGSASVTRGAKVVMMVGETTAVQAWAFVNRWTAEVVKA